MATASKSRNELQKAIAACDSAKADVQRAEDMLRSAHGMVTKLLSKLSDFATLDDEMSRAKAANVVRAIERGEDHLLTEPVSGFASKLVARDKLEEELGAVRQAIPSLEAEIQAAKQQVETCAYQIELACEAVFAKEADALAREYLDKLAEVRAMSQQIFYMAQMQVRREPSERRAASNAPIYYGNETTRKIAMTGHVQAACRENPHGDHDLRGGIALRERIGKAVASYFQRLHSDPQAQLEVEEPPKPFDPAALQKACDDAGVRTTRSYEPGSMT